jgi:hypothetical protein
MKTYRIAYHFGQFDATQRFGSITVDARFTINQAASIFAMQMDCQNLVIDCISELP